MTHPFDVLDDDERALLEAEDHPRWCAPMTATLTDEPFSDPDWLFEPKLDGVRAIGIRDGDDVHLVSRNRKVMDRAYPELVDALATAAPPRCVVDGEVVAFERGRTSFERLQGRMNLQDPERARASGIAVYLYLFDLLHLDGMDTTALPLRTRKVLLKQAVRFEDPVRFGTHRNEHGRELFDEACHQGWEGLIAKRADSRYRVGTRSRDWLKFKCVQRQEFVIGGFTDPRGSRVGFGALLVGYRDGSALRYAGKVGTGYGQDTLRRVRARMGPLERTTTPFDEEVGEKGAHWVAPRLVCEVAFTEWTEDGKLRHPRFLGLREDKAPEQVVREPVS
ncbi:MAG TPA: non-homologous end-joining DNA ligase [Nitriliruptorales bacterium]|nr:non-homologous end-joining DNA ligase [Nitriliruptorales bacterium]